MGSVQAKPSQRSSYRSLGKLKSENIYVQKGELMGDRRSTGPRDVHKESTGRHRSQSRKQNGDVGHRRGEGKLVNEEKRDVGDGGHVLQKTSTGRRVEEVELVDGWPKWLVDNVPSEVLIGMVPKSADSFLMLKKVGQGTYSNVYKARDRNTNKIVALKKVRFDTSEPESVKFMAREIMMLQKLDHPNIIKLEGLATSRLQYSLYLVFDFMQTDLSTVISRSEGTLTESQVKCYMHQLLSGLQHCHERGILHRDIKGSNLLIDKNGVLKIADFGLANYYNPLHRRPLTSLVVTLWYRAPELLLGANDYGVGIDLWSAGCLLAEMFAGRPIMPGTTEIEQLHRICKLCGTPSEEYWKKFKHSAKYKVPHFKPRLKEVFGKFPASSLNLLGTLLDLEPANRGSASSALRSEFFLASPLACNPSELPVFHNKDDELEDANEEKRPRSRMKQRSRTVRERWKKDPATTRPEENAETSEKNLFEDPAKTAAERKFQSQKPSSTTSSTSSSGKLTSQTESPLFTTTSNSSGARLSSQTESSPFLVSPEVSPDQRMSSKTQGHAHAEKNGIEVPQPPTSRTRIPKHVRGNDIHIIDSVQRSASTRDFRRMRS